MFSQYADIVSNDSLHKVTDIVTGQHPNLPPDLSKCDCANIDRKELRICSAVEDKALSAVIRIYSNRYT